MPRRLLHSTVVPAITLLMVAGTFAVLPRLSASGSGAVSSSAETVIGRVMDAFIPASQSSSSIAVGSPEQLRIARLKITAHVVPVGLAADGSMQSPQTWEDVGWYSLGAKPGEAGNAVIAGHLDSDTSTAVFWHLKDVVIGDEITVTDDGGTSRTFVVRDKRTYPSDSAPLSQIFGPRDAASLNLVTCSGTWDTARKRYTERLVIFSHEVPAGAMASRAQSSHSSL